MTFRLFPAAMAVATLLAGGAGAHEFKLGALTIGHPYALETPPGAKTGAGYLSVSNAGPDADRLIAVEADFPETMLHVTETDASGVSRMSHVAGFEVPAGGAVTLEPRGGHVMFMGLDGPLKAGDAIPATLVFEKAGRIDVVFQVQPRDAGGVDEHGGHADHGALAPDDDAELVASLMEAEFGGHGAPLDVAPVTVVADVAIAGWTQDGAGGRAFLRRGPHGWAIELCSGRSLTETATLAGLGLTADEAAALAAALAAAEADLPATMVARFDSFEGTVVMGEGGHHGAHGAATN